MQITAKTLYQAACAAREIERLEAAKDKLQDEEHVFRIDMGYDLRPVSVPVSAKAAREQVASMIREQTETLRSLGFDLLPPEE